MWFLFLHSVRFAPFNQFKLGGQGKQRQRKRQTDHELAKRK